MWCIYLDVKYLESEFVSSHDNYHIKYTCLFNQPVFCSHYVLDQVPWGFLKKTSALVGQDLKRPDVLSDTRPMTSTH